MKNCICNNYSVLYCSSPNFVYTALLTVRSWLCNLTNNFFTHPEFWIGYINVTFTIFCFPCFPFNILVKMETGQYVSIIWERVITWTEYDNMVQHFENSCMGLYGGITCSKHLKKLIWIYFTHSLTGTEQRFRNKYKQTNYISGMPR